MPRNNERRMSLNTVGYEPTVFTPIGYRPVEDDLSILERSFAKQEERQHRAIEQQTAIDVALGKVEEQLYNDPTINNWWNDYKQQIKDDIADAVSVGDYDSAIKLGIIKAGKISSDSALLGRLEASKNYNAWSDNLTKKREAGKITKDTEDYFRKNNPFVYEDAYDNNGNIIRGNTYSNIVTPVDDINPDDFIYKAFKLITPNKPESSNYKTINENGTVKQSSLEYIDEQQILNNLNEIFALEDNAREAFWQRYLVQKDKYKELEQYVLNNPDDKDAQLRLKQQKQIMGAGNGTVDFEHYVARTLGSTAISNNLAYRYKTSFNDYESTEAKAKAGRKGEIAAEKNIPDNPSTPGGSSTGGSSEPKQGEDA